MINEMRELRRIVSSPLIFRQPIYILYFDSMRAGVLGWWWCLQAMKWNWFSALFSIISSLPPPPLTLSSLSLFLHLPLPLSVSLSPSLSHFAWKSAFSRIIVRIPINTHIHSIAVSLVACWQWKWCVMNTWAKSYERGNPNQFIWQQNIISYVAWVHLYRHIQGSILTIYLVCKLHTHDVIRFLRNRKWKTLFGIISFRVKPQQ